MIVPRLLALKRWSVVLSVLGQKVVQVLLLAAALLLAHLQVRPLALFLLTLLNAPRNVHAMTVVGVSQIINVAKQALEQRIVHSTTNVLARPLLRVHLALAHLRVVARVALLSKTVRHIVILIASIQRLQNAVS